MTSITFPSSDNRSLDIDPAFTGLTGDRKIAKAQFPFGKSCWVVADHAEIRRIYSSDAFTRNIPIPDDAPRVTRAVIARPGSIGGSEGAAHGHARRILRRVLSREFNAAMEPVITGLVSQALDDIEAAPPPHFDFVSALGDRIPMAVLCHMLGVPGSDGETLRTSVANVFADSGGVDVAATERALVTLVRYVAELIETRRREPGTDLISQLIAISQDENTPLADSDLLVLGMSLVFAGYETTAVILPKVVLYLLESPERLTGAYLDDDRYLDELLRLISLGGGETLPWLVRSEVSVCGQVLQPGEFIVPIIGAANLDDDIFDDPTRFDPNRKKCPHLSFGYAEHYCLGSDLARMEITAVLSGLRSRFPEIRLSDAENAVVWRTGHALWGLQSLLLTTP